MTTVGTAFSDPEVRKVFEEELLFGESTDTIEALLESIRVSQRELARRLGVSEGRVSQLLSGRENLTLRTLGALGWALGVRFELNPVPMADRAGTPAQADPPSPAWLSQLRRQPNVEFRTISMPGPGKLQPHRPKLRLIEGVLQAA
jgi:transcriptional regulator with XRE-family HTH domain